MTESDWTRLAGLIRQIVREELAQRKRKAPSEMVSAEELEAAGVNPRHAKEWLAIRKAKTLPLTRTAYEQTQEEAKKAGLELAEVVRICCGMSWAGFKASWMDKVAPEVKPLPMREQAKDWIAEQEQRMADMTPEQLAANARAVREQVAKLRRVV